VIAGTSVQTGTPLGRVLAARVQAGRGYATLQFSTATDIKPVWQRVADGTLQSVTVGYRVHRYEQRPYPASGGCSWLANEAMPDALSVSATSARAFPGYSDV
jgi:hypothetical protein